MTLFKFMDKSKQSWQWSSSLPQTPGGLRWNPWSLCDDEALRPGPREEVQWDPAHTGQMVCPPQGGPQCTGEQGEGDAARAPEGLMVEGTTEGTLKALGEEEGGGGPERSGSRGAELREAGVSGAS